MPEILGFGTQSETTVPGSGGGYNDRLLFDSEKTRRDAAKRAMDDNQEAMYETASAVLEAKQWDTNFSKKFDEQRSYRDVAHQIKYYRTYARAMACRMRRRARRSKRSRSRSRVSRTRRWSRRLSDSSAPSGLT